MYNFPEQAFRWVRVFPAQDLKKWFPTKKAFLNTLLVKKHSFRRAIYIIFRRNAMRLRIVSLYYFVWLVLSNRQVNPVRTSRLQNRKNCNHSQTTFPERSCFHFFTIENHSEYRTFRRTYLRCMERSPRYRLNLDPIRLPTR